MTNFEAIVKMTPEQMEDFLDQVYLAGLNNGMYAQRTGDDAILDDNPFNTCWLAEEAEEALREWDAPEAEDEMIDSYAAAVYRNAGIPYPGNKT